MSKIATKIGLLNSLEESINPAKEDGNLANLVGLEIPAHDYIALTYISGGAADGEIHTVIYRSGGAGGNIVATLTLAYTGSDLTSITKT